MTLSMDAGVRGYDDEEYDVYAVMDAVPLVVQGVVRDESRFLSILSAFFGIDTDFVDAPKLEAT